MSEKIFTLTKTFSKKTPFVIEEDKTTTTDDKLKLKLRDLNLIKHNPNVFTNREGGVYNILGGNRMALFTLLGGFSAYYYRHQANVTRGVSKRIGIWNKNIAFIYGATLGFLFSVGNFGKTQILMNDYYAQCLFKRFPDSKKLTTDNLWQKRNIKNNDDCYYFTKSYLNTYHIHQLNKMS